MDLRCLIKETLIKTNIKTNFKRKLMRSVRDSKESKEKMKMLLKILLRNLRLSRKRRLQRLPKWTRAKQPISKRSKPRRKRKAPRNGPWSGTFNMLLWLMLCVISQSRSSDNYQSSKFMELSRFMDSERSGAMTKTYKLMPMFTIMTKWLIITLTMKRLVWDSKEWISSSSSWTAWSLVSLHSNVRSSFQLVTSNMYLNQEEAWTCFAL